jgi:hypothetical protein
MPAQATINNGTPWDLQGPAGTDVFYRLTPVAQSRGQDVTIRGIQLSGLVNRRGLDVVNDFRSLTIEDCSFDRFSKTIEGLHDDGIKISGPAGRIVLRRISLSNMGAGVMPIHCVDTVRADEVVLEEIATLNCVHPIHVGGRARIGRLVIRNCRGISVVGASNVPLPPVVWEGDCRGSDAYGLGAPDATTRLAELERDLAVALEACAQQAQRIAELDTKLAAWQALGARLRAMVQGLP